MTNEVKKSDIFKPDFSINTNPYEKEDTNKSIL